MASYCPINGMMYTTQRYGADDCISKHWMRWKAWIGSKRKTEKKREEQDEKRAYQQKSDAQFFGLVRNASMV